MSYFRKRRLAVVGTVLVLLLFLVRPGATRLKLRIARSVGQALQRQVEIGSAHVHLLPRPGFDLGDFVVREAGDFGAEPVLRAQEVAASLRLSALLRGRLEISRLVLTEPSLNLVRNAEGHWNIEQMLERASLNPIAPTAGKPAISGPAFPYIEADRGRINFKFGAEKKSFSLTDADYAIWQDSENAWGVRLKARPMRTDFNVSDTGQVRMTGSWQRSASLRSTPVQFNLQWDEAQLGQLTKLLSGEDKGWRGTVHLQTNLDGTPGDLLVHSDAAVDEFRRYDIMGGNAVRLRMGCNAHYSTVDRSFRRIACQSPIGAGSVSVEGNVLNWLGADGYDLTLLAQQVPVKAILATLRQAKRDLPQDLAAGGTLDVHFRARASQGMTWTPTVEGTGLVSDLRLKSESIGSELALSEVPLSFVPERSLESPSRTRGGRKTRAGVKTPDEPYLAIGPASVKFGRNPLSTVRGWLARSGYAFNLQGDSELQGILQSARILGIGVPQPSAYGSVRMDLLLAGRWNGLGAPVTTGTLQLRNMRAELRGLNGLVELPSANVRLSPQSVIVDGISAYIADGHWTGSLDVPRGCSSSGICPIDFKLHADAINIDALSELLSPSPPRRPWYRFLSGEDSTGSPFLSRIQAEGQLTTDLVIVRNVVASRVSAAVELGQGRLRFSDLKADVLGGEHRGEWRASYVVSPPSYSGEGTLEGVALTELGELMHDGWITGTGSAVYRITTSGYAANVLLASAGGTLRFEMHDGSFPHLILGNSPLRVRRFTGELSLHDGEFAIQEARLESSKGNFQVTGTVSSARKLDFKLFHDGAAGFTITGTLAEPLAVHADTQAALQPSSTQR